MFLQDVLMTLLFLNNTIYIDMEISLLIANILTLSALVLHTFVGDQELKLLEPKRTQDADYNKQEKWTMARCGWHWISFDLLFATIGLAIINFTDHLESENQLLRILAGYFFGYGIVWIIGIAISKSFPKNFLKLGQWMLLWGIGGLICWSLN